MQLSIWSSPKPQHCPGTVLGGHAQPGGAVCEAACCHPSKETVPAYRQTLDTSQSNSTKGQHRILSLKSRSPSLSGTYTGKRTSQSPWFAPFWGTPPSEHSQAARYGLRFHRPTVFSLWNVLHTCGQTPNGAVNFSTQFSLNIFPQK